jgi:prepilin-type N-terminal cleavage/methylation domain-containing protein
VAVTKADGNPPTSGMAVAKEAVMDTRRTWRFRGGAGGAAGFTLIELITAVAIIGILAAIALQAIGQYRAAAYDARAIHDLGNAVHAEEAYYATNSSYVSFTAIGPGQVAVPGVAVSGTVHLEMIGTQDQFEGSAVSDRGSGKTFSYDSVTDTFVNN